MEQYLKIGIEIIFVIVLQSLSSSLWSCAKFLRFRGKLLASYELLKTTVSKEDKSVLEQESKKVQPAGKSYADDMEMVLAAGTKAQNKKIVLLLFPIVAILAGSYFLGPMYLSMNISFFFLLALWPLTADTRTSVFADLLRISFNIYKWNSINAEACKKFCNDERPVFKNIYQVITEL